MDAKIDMLHQAGLLGTAKQSVVSNSESEIEDIVGHVRCSHLVEGPMNSTNLV